MLETIIKSLSDSGYNNCKVYNKTNKASLCENIIVCDSENAINNKKCYEMFLDKIPKNILPKHIEGVKKSDWIVLDFDKVMIHLFAKATREKYTFDKLYV